MNKKTGFCLDQLYPRRTNITRKFISYLEQLEKSDGVSVDGNLELNDCKNLKSL